ncbi:MAG: hypothetical protein JKX85_15655 [Phycisphaeraceae bacterium]|nr:hypothetical protein [Phycisphaeraceae bacterium]
MPQTRLPVPALFGGVSRQSAAIRHASQVENANNAYLSVIDGSSKRAGSRLKKILSGLDPNV